jgi:hypothetical protein
MISSDGEFESRPTAGSASVGLVALAEQQRQMAEFVTRYSQQVASVSTDSTLPIWMVEACVFILLMEVLYIGWSIAAVVGPEARAKYVEIIGLIMFALQITQIIGNRVAGERA